jgi:hypothetical protein
MSFVIGKSVGDNLLLFADTLTTDNLRIETKLADHVAKLLVLTPWLSVGFAGEKGPADEAVRSYRAPGTPWVRHAIRHFLTAHQASNCETEFILGLGDPIYRLVEIKGNSARLANKGIFAWIGHQAARERFQKDWSEKTPFGGFGEESLVGVCKGFERGWDEFNRMQQAMRHLVSASIPSVGGFITAMFVRPLTFTTSRNGTSRTDTFRGFVYTESYEKRTKVTLAENESITMSRGIETGSYTQYSTYGFMPPNHFVPVLYFSQPRWGLVFLPPKDGGFLRPVMVRGSDFAEQLKSRYQINLFSWPGPDFTINISRSRKSEES